MAVRITCIIKPGGHNNPHEAISYLDWINPATNVTKRSTRLEIYEFVKGGGEAYVEDDKRNKAFLMARVSAAGNPYVQTHADGIPTDNLLALPDCG
jgi:uncharacterized protein DUF3892